MTSLNELDGASENVGPSTTAEKLGKPEKEKSMGVSEAPKMDKKIAEELDLDLDPSPEEMGMDRNLDPGAMKKETATTPNHRSSEVSGASIVQSTGGASRGGGYPLSPIQARPKGTSKVNLHLDWFTQGEEPLPGGVSTGTQATEPAFPFGPKSDVTWYQFVICCDCTLPGEVLYIVGSEVSMGSWDPAKAVQCNTSGQIFPIWKSPLLPVPASTRKFSFKLMLQQGAGGRITWEAGENREEVVPAKRYLVVPGKSEQGRVTLRCAWRKLD